jgi:alpha-ketoglutarate-dependent taurine dioxygenase
MKRSELNQAEPGGLDGPSPFDLGNPAGYAAWRQQRLAACPRSADQLMVDVRDGFHLSDAEMDAIHNALARTNMAFYRLHNPSPDKALIRRLGQQFGLRRLDDNLCADEDSITSLAVVEERRQGEYIPYTSRRLNWHTDGYYNSPQEQIRGVILHCVQPAARGGENAFLDHELAYIHLRDSNPDYVDALMAPDAMTIPANVQNGIEIRPAQSGPVFSVDGAGHLHMRYSARTRNIVWKDDAVTRQAAECLLSLFRGDSPFIFRHRLKSGEGVLSNNVLHCRTSFENDAGSGQTRLLYRARYYDRLVDIRTKADF